MPVYFEESVYQLHVNMAIRLNSIFNFVYVLGLIITQEEKLYYKFNQSLNSVNLKVSIA